MWTLALRRLRLLVVPPGAGLPPAAEAVVRAELTALGFTVPAAAFDAVDPAWLARWPQLVAELRALKGADVDYVPLFAGFPDDVPDPRDYLLRRIVGYLLDADLPRDPQATDRLGWLFDLDAFGADPVTQRQTWDRHVAGRAEQRARPADGASVSPVALSICHDGSLDARLQRWLHEVLTAGSSVKEALHHDVGLVLSHLGAGAVPTASIRLKETLALVSRLLWTQGDLDGVKAVCRSATDVLRLFAALTETDVSLGSTVRFPRLSRPQRRAVLSILEACPQLEEDLARHRGLWKAVARTLHVGEHRARYPRTHQAVQRLRAGTLATFAGLVEGHLRIDDLDGVLPLLASRPGELARRLHHLLRRFPGRRARVLRTFAAVADQLPVKLLLTLRAYFGHIDDSSLRTVITKRGRVRVLDNPFTDQLGAHTVAEVQRTVEAALRRVLRAKGPWDGQQVWIDPRLASYTVPLQQRTASEGLLTVGRGTRLPLKPVDRPMPPVLRLFVWWRQAARDTDLDLSLIQFDAHWAYRGHVSYTQLQDQGIVHSGDLQSAPLGAAEFIDVTLAALPAGVRYLAPQIYRYWGEDFATVTAHAGWMLRTHADSRRASFDPATVVNKVDLTGRGAYAIPFVVDLAHQQIVHVDLFVGSRAFHNTAERSCTDVGTVCREVARFVQTRPNLADLARLHADARGATLTEDASAADVRFGLGGDGPPVTFDARTPKALLSALL